MHRSTYRHVLLICIALLVFTLRPLAAEEALLGAKERRAIASVTFSLARKGHPEATAELVDVLRALGAPSKEVEALEKKCRTQLAKVKKKRDAKAERTKLKKLAEGLAAELATRQPAQRRLLADIVLRLDAEPVPAHEALGEVRHRGLWAPAHLVPLLDQRIQIEDLVRKHRQAEFEIEVGISNEPGFQQAYGKRAAMARHQSIEVHVARAGAAGARRMLLQALRGWTLAATLAGVPPALRPDRPMRFAFHASHAEYLRSIQQAVAAGRLPASEAKQAADHRTYRTSDNFLVTGSGIEAHHQTFVMFDIWFDHARLHWDSQQPLPCLEAGHLNWSMLQVMGCPLPRIRWRETEFDRKLGATLNKKDNETRKHLLKLAKAGISGTRAYMRFLMERRLDPPWQSAFRGELGEVRGVDLLKSTIIGEYLLESKLLPKVFKETVDADENSVPATTKAIEAALGRSLGDLEKDLRLWISLRERVGVVQRLALPAQSTPKGKADTLIPYLAAIRTRAFRESSPIGLEAELSAGALAHARYLARHPKQAAAWPDAHEEYVDQEGYSPAGARAAASSVIAPGSASWRAAVDGWMGTFFHRLPLLHPGLLGVGAGLSEGMAVLDTASLVDEWSTRAYVAWPPKGEINVPRTFEPELPNPVPGVAQSTLGYPITLQIYLDSGQTGLVMKLRTADGSEVPCYFTAPHAPLNAELVPHGAYALIPKAPLKPSTTYTVQVDGLISETEQGTKEQPRLQWTFRTGS